MMRRITAFLLLEGALCGCHAFRTPFARPDVRSPTTYAHADTEARAAIDHWWEAYGDPKLNDLVDEALQLNPDLVLAGLNVRAAALQVHLAVINPAVSLGYTYDYSKPLSNVGPATQFHSVTASVSYEVDLWGQLAAQKDAVRWEAQATVEDRESAALRLIASVVNRYFEISNLNESIALGQSNIADAQKTLMLVEVLKSAGATTALEVATAQQALETERAAQAQLVEQRVEQRNALTVLLAGTPWPEEKERAVLSDSPPPAVDAGLPANLLKRRPDLKAAELRLRESLAQTDATRLSFYPNLVLTGSVGTATTGLSELVSNPLGSLAATLTAPLVQRNQAQFATALARTQYDEAVVRFKKILWQAFSDVDNALSARTQLEAEGVSLERSLQDAERIERLAEIRYRAGSVPLEFLLHAQQSRRRSELAVINNRVARLENYAALCQALGGGPESPW